MSELLEQIYIAYQGGSPAKALGLVSQLYKTVRRAKIVPVFPAGIRQADELLATLGREIWDTIEKPAFPGPLKGDLILATRVYKDGGHTPLIKDLSSSLPERPLSLWLTKYKTVEGGLQNDGALQRTGLADVTRLFEEKNPWLQANRMIEALASLRPARLFLLHHPEDCVAVTIAAAAAAMGSTIYLIHHADSVPSCGLYLKGMRIYDLTPRSCAFSRYFLGLHTAWLPLTCPDPQLPQHKFLSEGRLVTGLSGTRDKVKAMRDPEYPELVSTLLEKTRGRHVHIGFVDKAVRKKTLRLLNCKGIPAERICWVDSAPTLVEALVANNVDLMINTYPRGGARTAVETMAAGRAMVWHSPSSDHDVLRGQMRYPEAPVWRDLKDLVEIIEKTDRPWLEKQGASARHWYETQHRPDQWRQAIADYEAALQKELPERFDRELVLNSLLDQICEASINRIGKTAFLLIATFERLFKP
jgi:hypothetical protein